MDVADREDLTLLERAHERFCAGEPVESDVRPWVLTSWERSRHLGVVSYHMPPVYDSDVDLHGRLAQAATPVLDELEARLSGIKVAVVLGDEHARVLQRRVGEPALLRGLDDNQVLPGFEFSEQAIGTNGLGTALAERRPVLVWGREHYPDSMSGLVCAGSPIRDPISGRVEGVLNLACLDKFADPAMLGVAVNATDRIEECLLEQISQREQAMLRAFLEARRRGGEVGAVTAQPIDRAGPILSHDRLRLLEKATELISAGQAVVAVVPLSGGRTATLVSRVIENLAGTRGIAVEAILTDGSFWHVTSGSRGDHGDASTTRRGPLARAATPVPVHQPPTAEPAIAAGPASTVSAPRVPESPLTAAPLPGAPVSDTAADRWLLAVGEPGVGRLAVKARERLSLIWEAGSRVGTSLEVTRTAQELAEVAVPRFADFVAVDLPDPVLRGDEPGVLDAGLRRIALATTLRNFDLEDVGALTHPPPTTPQGRCLADGRSVLEAELDTTFWWTPQDPERGRRVREQGIHSLMVVPMRARDVTLGVASFYRSRRMGAFEEDDLTLAEELVGRAAVCIDNARRFTREHTMAVTLQRSLLPRGLPEQDALDVAWRYLPAEAGVGGDWFDVIPLPGARVALVVGDVVGHGLHAAATMGRLRTAVLNFSVLDLPPDELLAHLDDLVTRIDNEESTRDGPETHECEAVTGATCLYAIYDPVTGACTMARAGHVGPAVVHPDGTVTYPDVPVSPPLGLGGHPFETTELRLPEGSQLVLYTDGLIEDRHRDLQAGLDELQGALEGAAGRTPEETCQAVIDTTLPPHPSDDIALLVARTRKLSPSKVAQWDVLPDPAAVASVRTECGAQLQAWGLEDIGYTTELILSELITNAIKYGTPPITVRLLHSRSLTCEVSDGSSTSPHLRRAATTDEGGRGLFLVAQFAQRWGTRYNPRGKVIWAEQPLHDGAAAATMDDTPADTLLAQFDDLTL
ncbi:SpoIIE family protein phosphatase [Microbispora rosea]|uniref:SpoIIE family protein phosphatase n=1 Tax=Microbispora rosea TaxID=58117 RepID=UPI003685A4D1